MVEAVKVYAIGLGGDSEVRFMGGKGLAIYSGFTPSDAAHVQGMSHHWNAGAASTLVAFSQEDNNVNNDIDGNMFFEARVTATASRPPVTKE